MTLNDLVLASFTGGLALGSLITSNYYAYKQTKNKLFELKTTNSDNWKSLGNDYVENYFKKDKSFLKNMYYTPGVVLNLRKLY